MLIWRGDDAMKRLAADARGKVLKACLTTERGIKQGMKLGGRTAGGGKAGPGEKLAKIGTYRSAPGEPPRVQTGVLRRSYTHEMHETLPIGRVGTNIEYAKWLEWGTRVMAARPHVRPVLHALRSAYEAIFKVTTRGL